MEVGIIHRFGTEPKKDVVNLVWIDRRGVGTQTRILRALRGSDVVRDAERVSEY